MNSDLQTQFDDIDTMLGALRNLLRSGRYYRKDIETVRGALAAGEQQAYEIQTRIAELGQTIQGWRSRP